MKTHIRVAAVLACLSLYAGAARAQETGPAPPGSTDEVAHEAILASGCPCPDLLRASRLDDGSLMAVCRNGEDYRVFTLDGEAVALRCSAVRAQTGKPGCRSNDPALFTCTGQPEPTTQPVPH